MERILPLATNTAGYPPEQNNPNGPAGWDFIQLALQDSISAIMKQLTLNNANVIMLAGASITIGGGNYSTTAGWIWYSGDSAGVGELFYLPAIASTSMGGHSFLNAAVDATVSAADPQTYSDQITQHSPHVYRKIVLTPAAGASAGAYAIPAGSNAASLPYSLITTLPDATLWVSITKVTNMVQLPVGVATINAQSTVAYTTIEDSASNLATFTTPNDGVTRTYLIQARIWEGVTASGSNNSTYRIYNGSATLDSTNTAGTTTRGVCVSLLYVGSVAPNTTITIQAYNNLGTVVTENITFTVVQV